MQIIKREYAVATRSPKLVWDMISSADAMQKWLADSVTDNGNTWTFTWGHPWTERDTKTSEVLEIVKYSHIRLKWDYQEEDPKAFWELRIEQSELTGHIHLVVTDYADADDIDDLCELWDANMEKLHRISGL